MRVEVVTIGRFQSQSYLVIDEATSRCAIIDAGESGRGIAEAVARHGVEPAAVLLTHGHLDHAGGLAEVRRRFPHVPIHGHPADVPMVEAMPLQGRMFGIEIEAAPPLDETLVDGAAIRIGDGVSLRVIATPGHTPGGVTFHDEAAGVCFCGDTLFRGSVGRTDLPGGSGRTLLRSIRERLLALPDDTRCYPGHGAATTIGEERRQNPFLQPGAERMFGA